MPRFQEVADKVRAKMRLRLKGFFDPARTEAYA